MGFLSLAVGSLGMPVETSHRQAWAFRSQLRLSPLGSAGGHPLGSVTSDEKGRDNRTLWTTGERRPFSQGYGGRLPG